MKKIILSTIIAIFTAFSFTSCYDAIFSSIRNEVPLEDGEINGYINSVVRYQKSEKEYLYLQNGLIYYKQIQDKSDNLTKNESHGTWKKDETAPEGIEYSYYDSEFKGTYFFKLASDSTYLYALGYIPEYDESSSRNVPKEFILYCLDTDGSWKKVDEINNFIKQYIPKLDEDYYMMDASIQLFCTNTPKKENRKAYIRIGGGNPYQNSYSDKQEYGTEKSDFANGKCGILELNGTSGSTFINAGTKKIGSLSNTGAGKNTCSAIYANSRIYFLNNVAASTNETRNSDATYVYYGDGKTLRSFAVSDIDNIVSEETDGKVLYTSTTGCDDNIISLCATADSIILGTYESGAYRVKLSTEVATKGAAETKTSDFTTNADDVMYDPYIVRMLFCTDPSIKETETGSAIYSSIQFRYTQSSASASYSNVGLWSYYYARNNWNKE